MSGAMQKLQDIRTRALDAVERIPEHELRRLLERMAVTDPIVVNNAVERMDVFDKTRREVDATTRRRG